MLRRARTVFPSHQENARPKPFMDRSLHQAGWHALPSLSITETSANCRRLWRCRSRQIACSFKGVMQPCDEDWAGARKYAFGCLHTFWREHVLSCIQLSKCTSLKGDFCFFPGESCHMGENWQGKKLHTTHFHSMKQNELLWHNCYN